MFAALADQFITWTLAAVASWGYAGIFVLMTIESTIIPFPAELILIPAGALVAQGTFSGWLVLVAAILGSLVGALLNYAFAYYLGRKPLNALIHSYGKFFFINEKTVLKTEDYFVKHGHITTFIGRLIPGIRSFISLPAGFARMNLFEFSLFTSIGAGVWSALLILIGYFVGDNMDVIKSRLDLLSIALLIISIIIALFYFKKKSKSKSP